MERIKHKTRLPTANVNKSLPETPQPPSKPAPPNGMPRSQPQVLLLQQLDQALCDISFQNQYSTNCCNAATNNRR